MAEKGKRGREAPVRGRAGLAAAVTPWHVVPHPADELPPLHCDPENPPDAAGPARTDSQGRVPEAPFGVRLGGGRGAGPAAATQASAAAKEPLVPNRPAPGPGPPPGPRGAEAPPRHRAVEDAHLRAELAMAAGEDQQGQAECLRFFLDQASDVVVGYAFTAGAEPSPYYVYMNRVARQAVGLEDGGDGDGRVLGPGVTNSTLMGEGVAEARLDSYIKRAYHGQAGVRCEHTVPLPDGSERVYDTNYQPLRLPLEVAAAFIKPEMGDAGLQAWRGMQEGGAAYATIVVGFCRDVTEQYRVHRETEAARKVAEEAVKTKTMFLANMSHDIRTPLAGIVSTAELLMHTSLDAEQRWLAETMSQAGSALHALCNDIIDLTQLEKGDFKLQIRPMSLAKCLEETLAMVRPQMEDKQVELTVQCDDGLPEVMGDAGRIQQVAHNVLSNAMNHTFPGRKEVRVELAARPCARPGPEGPPHLEVTLRVQDSGPGISAENQKVLFQPFHMAENSAPLYKGFPSGLGLSIVKRLVDLMQGSVALESAPGKGATFTVVLRLPEVPREEARKRKAVEPHSPFADVRLLVAEDNLMMQKITQRMLKTVGVGSFEVVSNGKEALERFGAGDFDVLLLDWHMPVMDGLETLRQVKGLPAERQPCVVVLTADALSGTEEVALQNGADMFLSKPLRMRDVEALLKYASEKRGAGGQGKRAKAGGP